MPLMLEILCSIPPNYPLQLLSLRIAFYLHVPSLRVLFQNTDQCFFWEKFFRQRNCISGQLFRVQIPKIPEPQKLVANFKEERLNPLPLASYRVMKTIVATLLISSRELDP